MADIPIDPAHTNINFSAKHLMVTNVRGRVPRLRRGTLELDEADPTASKRGVPRQDGQRRHGLRCA